MDTDTPRDPRRRGGHVAIRHRDARRLQQALAERRVIVDHRDPDVLRLGLSPLTTSFTDVFDAMTVLAELTA
jgi:kynureninase